MEAGSSRLITPHSRGLFLQSSRLTEEEVFSKRWISAPKWSDSVTSDAEEEFIVEGDIFIPYPRMIEVLNELKPQLRLDERGTPRFWEDRYIHTSGVSVIYGNRHTFRDNFEYVELRSADPKKIQSLAKYLKL